MAEIEIRTERIDDVPLLVHQQLKMGIPDILDQLIQPHGNRQGLSVGWLATVWLSYILSQSDHRLSEVEPWVEQQFETLSALIPEPLTVKDFTDDRLADLLRYLNSNEVWQEVEEQLGQRLIQVYDLKQEPVRLDSTSVSVYHDEEDTTLFRQGHSKDHRPDLAQFKVMLSTLDPMGMPIATLMVAGNEADDALYVPTIQRSRKIIGTRGQLYVGDTKMGALATRGYVQAGGDYYLLPLAQTGEVPELLKQLLEPIWLGEQNIERVELNQQSATDTCSGANRRQLLAAGYQVSRDQQTDVNGQSLSWQERVLVVYSPVFARSARRGLQQRLERADLALRNLTPPPGRGKRQWHDLEPLQASIQAILKRYRVEGLLDVSHIEQSQQRTIRAYANRPARTEERVRYLVQVQRNSTAILRTRRALGWRLYVTNAPENKLPLAQAIQVYRGSPNMERNHHRLKGYPLGLRPMYVQREDHATGLVRLLSLALRVLTLVEHVTRAGMQAGAETLQGLYAGNPQRQTARPTTERLLKAFKDITLTVVKLPEQLLRHVTPLSQLQRRILTLLGLSASIYEELADMAPPIPP